jgi:protein involved in polysaccharide export with SLBB domain
MRRAQRIDMSLRRAIVASAAILIGVSATLPAAQAQDGVRPAEPATPSATPAPKARDDAASDHLVTNARSLSLRFSSHRELNGEYRVNADGTISIPVVGRIPVAGLTAVKLEQLLSEKLSTLTGYDTFVTVEVAEYRPVYVMGVVNRPGPTQWRPGMTVLQAIAAAGGIARPGRETLGSGDGSRLLRNVDEQKRALATYARLLAEQREAEKIDMPEELPALVGQAEAEKLIEAQTIILENRRSAMQRELKILEDGKALALQELDALKQQRDRIEEQIRLRREQRDKVVALLARGLTVTDRSLEENLRLSDLEERAANNSVATARVQATITAFDRDALTVTQRRQTEVETELLTLERSIAQTKLEIQAARSEAHRLAGEQRRVLAQKSAALRYGVTRENAGTEQPSPAHEATAVHPGDVIVVSRNLE